MQVVGPEGVSFVVATSATIGDVGGGAPGKHYFELWADPAPAAGPHAGPIEATTTKSLKS